MNIRGNFFNLPVRNPSLLAPKSGSTVAKFGSSDGTSIVSCAFEISTKNT